MHSVDKFEDEAFADKYMLAYRKHWKSLHGPSKLYVIVLRCLVKMVRFITILLLFPFNTFNKELNLFYCYLKGEISFDVLIGEDGDPAGEDENVSLKQKKKWTHPLTKRKYRNRFSLPDR